MSRLTLDDDGPDSTPRRMKNPPNPYLSNHVEWLDLPPKLQVTVYEERAKSIVSKNDSPDVGFNYSVNPYRGCFHGCAYCYARRSHQYLDWGAGTDFETKLVAKVNAPDLLAKSLRGKNWQRDLLVFSGITDCYQPLEANFELTRRCLEVCAHYRNPIAIITKGALVRRDIDILKTIHRRAGARVYCSIAFDDDAVSKLIEPGAPRPSLRFRVMRELAEAGIPVSLALAPIIPGLNDHDIPSLLRRAKDNGAMNAFMSLVRLSSGVREVFLDRIESQLPLRSKRIVAAIKDVREGELNQSGFGERMKGSGPRWDAVRWMFHSTCRELGLNSTNESEQRASRKMEDPQLKLTWDNNK